jgi:hypothetical protein
VVGLGSLEDPEKPMRDAAEHSDAA